MQSVKSVDNVSSWPLLLVPFPHLAPISLREFRRATLPASGGLAPFPYACCLAVVAVYPSLAVLCVLCAFALNRFFFSRKSRAKSRPKFALSFHQSISRQFALARPLARYGSPSGSAQKRTLRILIDYPFGDPSHFTMGALRWHARRLPVLLLSCSPVLPVKRGRPTYTSCIDRFAGPPIDRTVNRALASDLSCLLFLL